MQVIVQERAPCRGGGPSAAMAGIWRRWPAIVYAELEQLASRRNTAALARQAAQPRDRPPTGHCRGPFGCFLSRPMRANQLRWHALAVDTQNGTGRRIIERFRAQHGDKRVSLLHPEHIRKMQSAIPVSIWKMHGSETHFAGR